MASFKVRKQKHLQTAMQFAAASAKSVLHSQGGVSSVNTSGLKAWALRA
jgi:hypothetical protein